MTQILNRMPILLWHCEHHNHAQCSGGETYGVTRLECSCACHREHGKES